MRLEATPACRGARPTAVAVTFGKARPCPKDSTPIGTKIHSGWDYLKDGDPDIIGWDDAIEQRIEAVDQGSKRAGGIGHRLSLRAIKGSTL